MAKQNKTLYYEATGRRKESVCRVRLYLTPGAELKINNKSVKKGSILFNDIEVEKYFPTDTAKEQYLEPFRLTNSEDRFAVIARAAGGGKQGQLIAFRLAVARALEKVDKDNRSILKPKGLMSVDARVKERRKAGLVKARKQRQSPKR